MNRTERVLGQERRESGTGVGQGHIGPEQVCWTSVPRSSGTCTPAGYVHRTAAQMGDPPQDTDAGQLRRWGWDQQYSLRLYPNRPSTTLLCKQGAVSTLELLFLEFIPVAFLAKLPTRSPRR